MTRAAVVAAGLLVAVVAAQQAPPPTPPPTFRSTIQTVAVYATVQDREGRLVPDLKQDDFQILDDGKSAEITTFSNEVVPITVALMLDMSVSMVHEVLRVRESARHFVQVLLPADRVRIGTFDNEAAVSPHLTADKALLGRILDEEVWPGQATSLWNGLQVGMNSLDGESGRRVVLVLTDGGDACGMEVAVANKKFGETGWKLGPSQFETGCIDFGAVKRQAVGQAFMVYSIGMEGPGLDETMRSLSDDTGGGFFELKRNADLAATFERVADELHHQYTIGFRPRLLDGKTHRIEVKLVPKGMRARARKTYVAGER